MVQLRKPRLVRSAPSAQPEFSTPETLPVLSCQDLASPEGLVGRTKSTQTNRAKVVVHCKVFFGAKPLAIMWNFFWVEVLLTNQDFMVSNVILFCLTLSFQQIPKWLSWIHSPLQVTQVTRNIGSCIYLPLKKLIASRLPKIIDTKLAPQKRFFWKPDRFVKHHFFAKSSGQFITTSAKVSPNGGWVRESPQIWP